MLIEFRVENHRSIRDEQVLTLEAGRGGAADDPRPRLVDGHSVPLLAAAALYGANASGKSNLLSAFRFMHDAFSFSHRRWEPDEGVPRDAFCWGPKASEPSLFEVTFLVDGVRYRYGFVADEERFLEEWLFAWPKRRKQTWYVREGDNYEFGNHLRSEKNEVVEQITRPNALFLSAAVQHRHEQLTSLYNWFRRVAMVNVPGRRSGYGLGLSSENWLWRTFRDDGAARQRTLFGGERLSDGEDRRLAFRELLRAADVGIVDIRLESEDEDAHASRWTRRQVLVKHQSAAADSWLPLEEESQGTLTLFRIGPVLLETLRSGGLLVIDELEASLHPLLALHILRQFNDPRTNPRNAQLLFTTHDTNLLGTVGGEAPLRRDQIWLTEKDKEGATCFYPLTDYTPRKAENLERGYLQGRYGAIPFLGELIHADVEE